MIPSFNWEREGGGYIKPLQYLIYPVELRRNCDKEKRDRSGHCATLLPEKNILYIVLHYTWKKNILYIMQHYCKSWIKNIAIEIHK